MINLNNGNMQPSLFSIRYTGHILKLINKNIRDGTWTGITSKLNVPGRVGNCIVLTCRDIRIYNY